MSDSTTLQDVSDCLGRHDPQAALDALKGHVRHEVGDAGLRLSLAQLELVNGDWDKAAAALDATGTLDPERAMLCQQWRVQIEAERTRAEVFAGRKTAFVIGEPAPWIAAMQDALRLDAQGEETAADAGRRQALESAPARSGTIDGTAFEWLCDADERLGPIFEAIVNGRYTWIPQDVVQSITIPSPRELIDGVWSEVVVRLTNGGETGVMMPVRYPGSEQAEDGRIRLARLTTFDATTGGTQIGLGQRLFATDDADHPLLQTRLIEFNA